MGGAIEIEGLVKSCAVYERKREKDIEAFLVSGKSFSNFFADEVRA